jgi:hypothetical protein
MSQPSQRIRMSEQIPLIVDTLNDAVRDTARIVGFKEIARSLWPAKGQEAAARYLNDCLNNDREQKLSGEEIMVIARRGREIGCYLITAFINAETGFALPTPIDPEDQKAELQRRYIASVQEQKAITARMERLG